MTDDTFDRERIVTTISTIAQLARAINLKECDQLLEQIECDEALLPFFDPTGYIRHGDRLHLGDDLARAFVKFRREIEPLLARAQELQQQGRFDS